MRLLGAFFNIFAFYYFLAMCGSTGEPGQSVEQGVEAHAVQATQMMEEAINLQGVERDSFQVNYFFDFTTGPVLPGLTEG